MINDTTLNGIKFISPLKLSKLGTRLRNIKDMPSSAAALRAAMEKLGGHPAKQVKSFSGALRDLVANKFLTPPRTDNDGKIIPIAKGQVLRTPDGDVVYMNITDSKNLDLPMSKRNTVHMYWCGALTNAWEHGREDRYHGTTDTSGRFRIEEIIPHTRMMRTRNIPLPVCKNCYGYIRSHDYGTVYDFDFAAFSRDYAIRDLIELGQENQDGTTTWICTKCGKVLQDHENLRVFGNAVYCKDCSKEAHLLLSIRKLRTVEDLEAWIKNGGDVNAEIPCPEQWPILYLAKNNADAKLITAMANYGADIHKRDKEGHTLLMCAVMGRKPVDKVKEAINEICAMDESMIA